MNDCELSDKCGGANMNTLDLDGSREIIAGLVADYEAALDGDDIEKGMECRWKLERWLWPLARWYLDNTKE